MQADTLLFDATVLTEKGEQQENQSIVIDSGRIKWCGAMAELPAIYRNAKAIEDCQGRLITPGFIDCHTHLVYGGGRANEFEKRLKGVSYSEIARAGGGILSTVKQTRQASFEELLEQTLPRLLALRAEGVTTVEIKSGYGLDRANEIKMLKVARALEKLTSVRVKTTFLGAHTIPWEFKENSDAYVDYLCEEVLPDVAALKLADAVDIFCENIAFSLNQAERIFLKAKALGFPIKCHAEQLSNLGASEMAASLGALSCDHLEYLDKKGALAMAKHDAVAVLLPGAFYFLKETRVPPIALLRELGVKIAIATDSNPGSSPTTSILLMMNMACQFFGLTVAEALAGVTFNAAKALGIDQQVGAIKAGLAADLVRWEVKDKAYLCYYFGHLPAHTTMIAGQWL